MLILGQHPDYDPTHMIETRSGRHYSVAHIFNAVPYPPFQEFWINMLLYDYIIGNSDRHHSNWAYIYTVGKNHGGRITVRPCPLYDNGSSLCCYVREDQLQDYLGKDKLRLESLVNTKSKSLARINPYNKKRPLHTDVVRHLLLKYPAAKSVATHFVDVFTLEVIQSLVEVYPEELVSSSRKELLTKYLAEKVRLLEDILAEDNYGQQKR